MTRRYRDGGGAQSAAAYVRAVRRGALIAVSGTAALGPDGQALHPGDTEAQTRVCFERALAALEALHAGVDDVIRTRVLLTPQAEAAGATRVHRELFTGREPASTFVYVAGFIPEGVLVEVELDALVEEGG
jgi:enamine deaminase RidA (YjgF/YER057c/UK114 family)